MIEQGSKEYWRATIALSIGSFVVFEQLYLTQPLLPIFREEFGLSPSTSSLSLSIVTLMISLSLLIYGPFSDSYGRKPIMVVTMLGALVSTFLPLLATDYKTIIILRGIQGIFLGGLPSIAVAYMSEEFSAKGLSLAIGLYISANSLGGMSGRLMSGFAADYGGWKTSFLVIGLISSIFFILFVSLLPPSRQFQKSPFHLKESVRSILLHIQKPFAQLSFYYRRIAFFRFYWLF